MVNRNTCNTLLTSSECCTNNAWPASFIRTSLDGNHDGVLSLPEVASKINGSSAADAATKEAVNSLIKKDNKTGHYEWQPGFDADKDGTVNIDKELKPQFVNILESLASFPAGKCTSLETMPYMD